MSGWFEIIDHTADVAIAAHGDDMKEAFAAAAYGMFSIIADIDGVKESLRRDVAVRADDNKDLLVSWLNELIYVYEVERLLLKRFDIIDLSDKRLEARCFGEAIDSGRHEIRTGIKAATYHMLQIEEDDDGVRVQVLFDI